MDNELERALADYKKALDKNPDMSMSRLLPLIFRLKGKPYSLDWSHFMFEPMFRLNRMPRQLMLKTGRQCGKSISLAASQVWKGLAIPYYNILTVMPLFEQVRKFSANSVAPFIRESPILASFKLQTDSVLQRDLGNGSRLLYSYSQGNPNRIRGIQGDELCLDEAADMDISDLGVLEACLAASKFKLERFTGTPKTFDNTMQLLWDDSSQAEWSIQCQSTGCKYANRAAAVAGDLLKMIGDKTLICAKCGCPLDSRSGHWVHGRPDRISSFPGYHVPQPILPMHYESPKDWQILLDFRDKKPTHAFYNEILGESYDSGAKILTYEQLCKACTGPICTPETFEYGAYTLVTVGVDWGGRGKEKTSDTDEFISNTAITIAAMRPDGSIDIPWVYKVPYTVDHFQECKMVADVCRTVRAAYCAMDYGGQGNVLEEMVIAAGWPRERICPFTYTHMSNDKPIVMYNPPKARGVRTSYSLDKARSNLLLCELIKAGQIHFGNSDEFRNSLLNDFLNIYEESTDNPRGSPTRLIKRMSRRTDDVVHSVNFAVMAMYHSVGAWPELANIFIEAS